MVKFQQVWAGCKIDARHSGSRLALQALALPQHIFGAVPERRNDVVRQAAVPSHPPAYGTPRSELVRSVSRRMLNHKVRRLWAPKKTRQSIAGTFSGR